MFLQRLHGIFGTGGDISAGGRSEGGDTIFVEINRQQEECGKEAPYHFLS
jgi:hypothetical protein